MGLGTGHGAALCLSPTKSQLPCPQARTREPLREGLSPGVHAQEAAGGPAEGDKGGLGVGRDPRATPGKRTATLTPASSPHPQEKADKAALEEEVRSLRHNNRRLQAESESAATRLLLASKQLGSPATDLA